MTQTTDRFLRDAALKSFDQGHRKRINFNMGRYHDSVSAGLKNYANHDLARERASHIKLQVINNLDKYLIEFEQNFTANGGKVLWARNAEEALKEIQVILKKKNARSVVKSKTMTSEEIHLNDFLEKNGVEAVETDLGEYIVQLAGQKPYHIVTPAMHMSKEDISKLFTEKLNTAPTDDARELTLTARRLLRQKYLQAEIGITGGNFLVADVGGIAVTENEGNARLSTCFPKTHIAIVGIEKIIPSITDLGLFWPLLSTSGTGQAVTVYNSVFTGPRKSNETDGPDEMYVILLDNGRTELLAKPETREALKCIRCGACLNACPVYKNIGGHTYNTTYSGPIGSVISPHFMGFKDYKHLSYSSSLCGACTTVCPVKINIHEFLLLNRSESVKNGMVSRWERWGFKMWKKAMLDRKLMDKVSGAFKAKVVKFLFKSSWGKRRTMPHFPEKSFNQLWQERTKVKK